MFVGRISDVFGHQIVFIVGVVLYAVGFLAASFATQVWHLYLTHGVIWGLSVAWLVSELPYGFGE
jgi:OFA family oxalate/formate antiporter-like MFS transporter